jgi:hypothetical protein
MNYASFPNLSSLDTFWIKLRQEAKELAKKEAAMSKLLQQGVLNHTSFSEALVNRLALKLSNDEINATSLKTLLKKRCNEPQRLLMLRWRTCVQFMNAILLVTVLYKYFCSSKGLSHCKLIAFHIRYIAINNVKWHTISKAGYQNSSV